MENGKEGNGGVRLWPGGGLGGRGDGGGRGGSKSLLVKGRYCP